MQTMVKHHIRVAPKNFAAAILKAAKVKIVATGGEMYQKIDITVGPFFAARDRTEKTNVAHTVLCGDFEQLWLFSADVVEQCH